MVKGTFKHHITILRLGKGFAQTVRVPSYRRVWPNRHITFIVAKKLNLQVILLCLWCMWGRRLAETQSTVMRHMGGGV